MRVSVARSAGFASLQSQQSVLKGTEIENKCFFEKNFFYKLKATGNALCGFDLFMNVYAFFSLVCLNIIFITPVFARANMRMDRQQRSKTKAVLSTTAIKFSVSGNDIVN